MSKPTTSALPMPAAYSRLILRHFGRTPELAARITEGTGIDSTGSRGAHDVILLEQQLRQIRNLSKVVGPAWALDLGKRLGTSAHGDLAIAAASASDLGKSLSMLERFAYLRAPYFLLESEASPDFMTLRIRPRLRLESELWIALVESLLLSIQDVIESALGRPIDLAQIDMAFDAPAYVDRYAEAFHAPVIFGSEHTSIRIPSAWRLMPCPFSDIRTHRQAVERLEAAERSLLGLDFVVGQVENELDRYVGALPGIERVSRRLGLSRRTLVRRLTAQGTSYREVTERILRERAVELLLHTRLAISEISHQLGYSEPSNFSRAFRRWFGMSPIRFRDSAGSDCR